MDDINQLVNRAEEFMVKAPYLPLGLAKEMIAALKKQQKWISVKDRMPDSNHVLARCEIRGLYKPKSYTCVAFYAKKNSISVGNCFDDEISCEYDEETDEYYLKEGWYEVIRNWDEYGSVVIGDFVTHWMPLPSTEGLNET